MKRNQVLPAAAKRKSQAGMTMIETMIAIAMLLVVATGVLGLAVLAVSTTETQGHLAARTAEYAQDKMEQLLALAFCDGGTNGQSGTDTTQFPAVAGTGATYTGLAGCTAANAPLTGGNLTPSAPARGYVDYLDVSGSPVTNGNWEYVRVWQITAPSTTIKQISVLVQANHGVGNGLAPQSTVVALKTFPF
jgi:prepilin-type N-terminal cleavage/methylation domain-containing protein